MTGDAARQAREWLLLVNGLAKSPVVEQAESVIRSLADAVETLTRERERLLEIAQLLFQMVDRETWRATGGDDGQGHYEGDYRAERIGQELRALAAVEAGTETPGETP